MEFTFDLIPLIFGLFWFIFVISLVARIGKALKKAASGQQKGFDQQTILKRLDELRRAMEEKQGQAAGSEGHAATLSSGPSVPYRAGQGTAKPSAPPARRSRFEDYSEPASHGEGAAEGEAAPEEYSEAASGSMEGTSSESLFEARQKDKYGNLTPFQQELASAAKQQGSQEGAGSEEAGLWKGDEMCEAWDTQTSREGEGLEAEFAALASQGEPAGVDLVGWINVKEMADAVVWHEIMGKPLVLRRRMSGSLRRSF